MPSKLMTPGVFIEEKNAFPHSAVAVETAIPAFIGYTAKAERNGKSLLRKPAKIASLAEYVELFGAGFKAKYGMVDAAGDDDGALVLNGSKKTLRVVDNNTFYLFNSIRLFYANGGSSAYIISVGTYDDKPEGFEIAMADFIGSDGVTSAIDLLISEPEPTMIIIPDAIALGEKCYDNVYTAVLQHCAKTQSRFGIFDLVKKPATATTDDIVAAFREKIGVNALGYGAAYYPWVNATIVQPDDVSFENLAATVDLYTLLPEDAAKETVKKFTAIKNPTVDDKKACHTSLKANSPTYAQLMAAIQFRENELPPSGAIAGMYTFVDHSRGVWKAPANTSLSMVSTPNVHISNDTQQQLNVDGLAGKSINVIRAFPGVGNMVWGGRTLDGNSQDWRYVNVRRTLIMIEQSVKLACRAYVFEPNTNVTWISLQSMIANFLTSLWKQGALAGASREQAFDVQVGLGTTMTTYDIVNNKMVIVLKLAVVRPAEFIVLTITQPMQQS